MLSVIAAVLLSCVAVLQPATELVQEPAREPSREPAREPAREPVKEPALAPVGEPTKAPVAAAAAVAKDMDWTVGGVNRKAIVYLPAAATKSNTPVIFAFHGHGGNSRSAAKSFGYHKLWPEAISVYMEGLPTVGRTDPKGEKNGWQNSRGEIGDRDLKFFDAVLGTLRKDYKVDDRRIYATGHSNGAGFTYCLWAARADIFAAFAPSAGGSREVLTLKAKPAMHIAGEQDEIVLFANQQRTMERLRKINGCEAQGKEWAKSGSLTATLYASKTQTPFVSVIYPGTHKFPAEAPALVVKFFKEQAKPAPAAATAEPTEAGSPQMPGGKSK